MLLCTIHVTVSAGLSGCCLGLELTCYVGWLNRSQYLGLRKHVLTAQAPALESQMHRPDLDMLQVIGLPLDAEQESTRPSSYGSASIQGDDEGPDAMQDSLVAWEHQLDERLAQDAVQETGLSAQHPWLVWGSQWD